MDVRCEKCETVYELDAGKISDSGVTVKCAKCGNLFRVMRRLVDTNPSGLPSGLGVSLGELPPTMVATPGARPSTLQGIPPAPAGEGTTWIVRIAITGEEHRMRDLTILQKWIVERKVSRNDEISRFGDVWKRLGDIPELAPFFNVVEQAVAATTGTLPAYKPSEFTLPDGFMMPLDGRMGPTSMGQPQVREEATFAPQMPAENIAQPLISGNDDLDELDLVRSHTGRTALILVLLLVALSSVAYWKRSELRRALGMVDGGQASASETKTYQEARRAFLLDTDDGFRRAIDDLEAVGKKKGPLVNAGLAMVHTTWAEYLFQDARSLETTATGAAAQLAAQTLQKEARRHLDAAEQAARASLAQNSELPEGQRALAEQLRVSNAPTGNVEKFLARAHVDERDWETLYATAALAQRDGKSDEALAKLEECIKRSETAGETPARALYLAARVAQQKGDVAGATKYLEKLIAANGTHDRARALMDVVKSGKQAAPPPAVKEPAKTPEPAKTAEPVKAEEPAAMATKSVPSAATTTKSVLPAPPTVKEPPLEDPGVAEPAKTPEPKAEMTNEPKVELRNEPKSEPKSEPKKTERPVGDYNRLVSQADKLSENGSSKRAKKLYEQALKLSPRGVEALTGLGYCALDVEKFSAAVDKFKQALDVAPSYGEAILGLAEAYKQRGDRSRAVEQYQRYLRSFPRGTKSEMARKNLQDLGAARGEE